VRIVGEKQPVFALMGGNCLLLGRASWAEELTNIPGGKRRILGYIRWD